MVQDAMRNYTSVAPGLFYYTTAVGEVGRAEAMICKQVAALGMAKGWPETIVNA